MPRACCICLVVMAFLLTTTNGDNDRPIISYWSRGVCPPELQAFLHPANKPPALPTSKVSGAVLRSSGKRVTGLVSPSLSGNGQSRPVTEHRPPAWGQHGVLYNNQKLMTAFPFRSCWVPHGARDSVFNIGLSDLKAWPVVPSGEDNSGVAPRLHAEGLCETTAALRVRTLEHDRVDRRVQGPVIPASTPGACVRRLSESIPSSR